MDANQYAVLQTSEDNFTADVAILLYPEAGDNRRKSASSHAGCRSAAVVKCHRVTLTQLAVIESVRNASTVGILLVLLERNEQGALVAPDQQQGDFSMAAELECSSVRPQVVDRLAIDFQNHVAHVQSGTLRRAARPDCRNYEPMRIA